MTPRQRFVATALGVLAGIVASLGTLAVTSAGFALSFDAIRAVGAAAHLRPSLTWLLPVCVDGAMAVSAVCAVVLKRMGRSNLYPWSVVVIGALISIAANALHAYQRGGDVPLPVEWAMAASAVPALLLALSVHLLVILAEAVRQPASVVTSTTQVTSTTVETPVVDDPHKAYDAAMAAVEDALTGPTAEVEPHAVAGETMAAVGAALSLMRRPQIQGPPDAPSKEPTPKAPRKPARTVTRRPNGRKETNEDRVAKVLKRSPDLSKAQVAAKLGVSERTVQRAWPVPSTNGSEPAEVAS